MLTTARWNYTKEFTGMWNSIIGNENIKALDMLLLLMFMALLISYTHIHSNSQREKK
nr:hypothetical protein [[Flexibacter] sp. ATCC 35208]